MATKFEKDAPWLMGKLIEDFGFTVLDAAAIAGNAGHESAGFTALQEIKPTVPGSRGGYGWFQWTGPRRREFEAYLKRNGLDGRTREANYAWLFNELKGSEKGAVAKTKAAKTLADKVVAFELAYERAGVKHYPSRVQWAEKALASYKAPAAPVEVVPPTPVPAPTRPPETLWTKLLRLLQALLVRR